MRPSTDRKQAKELHTGHSAAPGRGWAPKTWAAKVAAAMEAARKQQGSRDRKRNAARMQRADGNGFAVTGLGVED